MDIGNVPTNRRMYVECQVLFNVRVWTLLAYQNATELVRI